MSIARPIKLIFMGTSNYALPSLKALIEGEDDIIGAVTKPDRPKGRGRKLTPPPIKELADEHHLPVFQPEKVKERSFIDLVGELAPSMIVIVAFGQILPQALLELPPLGCINLHPSLLPNYRGPAPINQALINGDRVTGVTTIKMDAGVDSGDILFQEPVTIEKEDNFIALHDKLAIVGANLLKKTLDKIKDGTAIPFPQDSSQATSAPFLKKEDGRIAWDKSAREIFNLIRGMNPWPGAFTCLGDKILKIFNSSVLQSEKKEIPGTICSLTSGGIKVATGEGLLMVTQVQLQGRRKMGVDEFLRGHKIVPGTILL